MTYTAPGIYSEKIHPLFQDFSQTDLNITKKYGGPDQELFNNKRLCQLMRGDISISSALGKGSTFRVKILPAQPGKLRPDQPPPLQLDTFPNTATGAWNFT